MGDAVSKGHQSLILDQCVCHVFPSLTTMKPTYIYFCRRLCSWPFPQETTNTFSLFLFLTHTHSLTYISTHGTPYVPAITETPQPTTKMQRYSESPRVARTSSYYISYNPAEYWVDPSSGFAHYRLGSDFRVRSTGNNFAQQPIRGNFQYYQPQYSDRKRDYYVDALRGYKEAVSIDPWLYFRT